MTSQTSSGGIGLGGVLFCIFLTLKLIAIEPVASWSWWWITSPLWISWGIALILIFIFVFTRCVGAASSTRVRR